MEEELEMRRFEIKAYRDRSKQINHACFCQSKMLLFYIVILCTIYVFLIMFNPSTQQCKQSRIFENDCCKEIFGLWEPVQAGSSVPSKFGVWVCKFIPVQNAHPRHGVAATPFDQVSQLKDACRCLSMPWGFFNLKHGAERRWESGVFIDVYSAWRVFEMFGYVWYRSTWSRLQFLQGTAKCRGQGGVVSWCPHHCWSSLVIVTKTWSMITTMCHDVWRCVMCLYFGSQTLSLCRGFRCITLFCFQIGICE